MRPINWFVDENIMNNINDVQIINHTKHVAKLSIIHNDTVVHSDLVGGNASLYLKNMLGDLINFNVSCIQLRENSLYHVLPIDKVGSNNRFTLISEQKGKNALLTLSQENDSHHKTLFINNTTRFPTAFTISKRQSDYTAEITLQPFLTHSISISDEYLMRVVVDGVTINKPLYCGEFTCFQLTQSSQPKQPKFLLNSI